MERILENLLVNAGKHTPEGSTIWVKVSKRQDDVVIIVEDDGPGVPEELRERIFEPFQQGRAEQPSPGTGIGLSLLLSFTAERRGSRTVWAGERRSRSRCPWAGQE